MTQELATSIQEQGGYLRPIRESIFALAGGAVNAVDFIDRRVVTPAVEYTRFAGNLGGALLEIAGDSLNQHIVTPTQKVRDSVSRFLHEPMGDNPSTLQMFLRPNIVSEHGMLVLRRSLVDGQPVYGVERTFIPPSRIDILKQVLFKTLATSKAVAVNAWNSLLPLDDPRNPLFDEGYADIPESHPLFELHTKIREDITSVLIKIAGTITVLGPPIVDYLLK